MLSCNQTHRGKLNYVFRPALTLILFTSAESSLAQSTDVITYTQLITPDNIAKLLLALIAITLTHAMLPAIKSLLEENKKRLSFRRFLKQHVENTTSKYGSPCNLEMAKKLISKDVAAGARKLDWLEMLETSDLGVPEMLIEMQKALDIAVSKHGHDKRYIPFLSYFGFADIPLEHDSIVWNLNKNTSRSVMDYIISEKQVKTALEAQYEATFFRLIESDLYSARQQWCKSAEAILCDLSEHYINTRKLAKAFEST